jgi:hypothetical protein
MRTINPNSSKKFVDAIKKHIEANGGVLTDVERNVYRINTEVGMTTITVPEDQGVCYTIYNKFDEVEKAHKKFPFSNGYSGKYNLHFSIIPIKDAITMGINFIDKVIGTIDKNLNIKPE